MAVATGTALLGGALIGGAAGLYSANKQSEAIEDAANTQARSANYAADLQMQYLREVRADIADAVEKGTIDLETGFNAAIGQLEPLTNLTELNIARSLLSDPGSIMDRPSVRFQYGQGLDALTASQSRTSGGGTSGRAMKAATEYGQNFASTALDAELARLYPFINTAVSARTNTSNLLSNKGQALSSLRMGGATGTGNLTTGTISNVASGINASAANSAAAGIAQSNIQANALSEITNNIANMATLYALKPDLFSGTK